MQIKDDSFVLLDKYIINKYSSNDYSIIKSLPNIANNEKIIRIKDDIYCLYGGTEGKSVENLLCFIDINKFDILYFKYNEYIIKYLCPLFINDYFYSCKEYDYIIDREKVKLIEYENTFEFIKSDYIEKAEYLKDIPSIIHHSISLGNNKVIYYSDEEVFLIEFN